MEEVIKYFESLEERIATLEAELASLEAELDELKSRPAPEPQVVEKAKLYYQLKTLQQTMA